MEYNTQKEKLIIPEYGRHIQQMVDYCVTIEEEEKRNNCAHAIIDVMGNLNTHLRDVPDFQHKLWDQLFIMSGFKLDVNSPYPILTEEEIAAPPKKMNYPEHETLYKYYGSNIRKMISAVKDWEEGDKKEGVKLSIANQMKKNYVKWNKDSVEDSTILAHLLELSKGQLSLPEDENLVHVTAQNNNTHNNNSENNNKKKNGLRKRIKR